MSENVMEKTGKTEWSRAAGWCHAPGTGVVRPMWGVLMEQQGAVGSRRNRLGGLSGGREGQVTQSPGGHCKAITLSEMGSHCGL